MLKTHEFRAKDLVVRSARSFERSEMQILYRGKAPVVVLRWCDLKCNQLGGKVKTLSNTPSIFNDNIDNG